MLAVPSSAAICAFEIGVERGDFGFDLLQPDLRAFHVLRFFHGAADAAGGSRCASERRERNGPASHQRAEHRGAQRYRGLHLLLADLLVLAFQQFLRLAFFLLSRATFGRETCAQRFHGGVTQLSRCLLRADAEVAFALARFGQQFQLRARRRASAAVTARSSRRSRGSSRRSASDRARHWAACRRLPPGLSLLEQRVGRLDRIVCALPVDRNRAFGEGDRRLQAANDVDAAARVGVVNARGSVEHRTIRGRRPCQDLSGNTRERPPAPPVWRTGRADRRGGVSVRLGLGDVKPLQFVPAHRASQVRQRPSGLERDGTGLVHVVHQEHAAAQRRERSVHRLSVESPGSPSRPSSTRALSRSVCSLPRNHVPMFDNAL